MQPTLGGFTTAILNLSVASNLTLTGYSFLADTTTRHAVRWTAGNVEDLGTLGGSSSIGSATSGDGSVIVGQSETVATNLHSFRWTRSTGMVDIGTLGGLNSIAYGASANGNIIVGASNLAGDSVQHAYRWTANTGMLDIGTLGGDFSSATNVTPDGRVIVGWADIVGGNQHAFRWTSAGGMEDIGVLPGGISRSLATSISADHKTIVGYSFPGAFSHAFRWTRTEGMVDMGTLGGSISQAVSVSGNGSIIVGQSQPVGINDFHAFRWTQATGMKDLNSLLTAAGVDLQGNVLTSASGISLDGRYIVGTVNTGSHTGSYLACYDPGASCVGLATAANQQTSVQQLAANQQATAVESRSTANELLGFTRPMDSGTYVQAGAMFGSAEGIGSGQWSSRGLTLIGGVAYGAQDYPNVSQDDAATIAGAARYTFDDPFADTLQALHPYAEIGGWLTPQARLSFSRPYGNGFGGNTGTGSADSISWAEYGRGGLIWNATPLDTITGYGELGQQWMHFGAYSEDTANNPFPATVGEGLFRMGVARLGGLWTRKLDDIWGADQPVPLTFTVAGAAVRSFNVHSGLTANVAGLGSFAADDDTNTWGEFGARLEAQLTEHIAFGVDLTGTTGGGAMGTSAHGGFGVSYKF